MRASLGSDADVEFGEDKPVVRPALCATHCFGHPDILSVTSSNNYVIDQVPVLATRVHPRSSISDW